MLLILKFHNRCWFDEKRKNIQIKQIPKKRICCFYSGDFVLRSGVDFVFIFYDVLYHGLSENGILFLLIFKKPGKAKVQKYCLPDYIDS